MLIPRQLKLFLLWLLAASCFTVSAQAQADLSGLWTGRSSGNQVTIEMRTGGFAIIVAGQRRAGQYGDGQFFREAGAGLYLFTKPDGNKVKVQVLGTDSIRVTNPDGWTDVFTRPPRAVQRTAPVPVAPNAVSPPQILPPARPAKTAAWTTKAMPTEAGRTLSPDFAAERADALASCAAPLKQFASNYKISLAEANLLFEQNWLRDAADMGVNAQGVVANIANVDREIAAGNMHAYRLAGLHAGRCLHQRRLAQLQGSPLAPAAVDGSLTPLSIGGQTPPWKQQGKDARIIASDGKSAMHCVKLEQVSSGDSRVGVGGRRLFNYCPEAVEIVWCISPGECDRDRGNMWTVRPNYGWPISANGEVRWAACLGANTAAHVKGTFGMRYYCSAPLGKPKR